MSEPWAAILAGGDGRRLKGLTRSMAGDARPKQFCQFFGGKTLLGDTRDRVGLSVSALQTLFVVTRAHQPYYRDELADVPAAQVIEQPANRGTTAAVAATLFWLRDQVDARVGFFPADHYYRDTGVLRETLATAFELADANPDRVIALGAKATRAETEYGWIEPGDGPPGEVATGRAAVLRTVRGFWEKPSYDVASNLWARGCLWNTLVVVGRVSAFETLLAQTVPDVWHEFVIRSPGTNLQEHQSALRQAYASVRPSDFSHEVLAAAPDRLSVIALPDTGWTDLGQPHRVLDVLADRDEVLKTESHRAG